MDRKDVLPQKVNAKELTEEESYVKLLVLKRELDKERGRSLTDQQASVLQAIIESLIDARARIKCYEDE